MKKVTVVNSWRQGSAWEGEAVNNGNKSICDTWKKSGVLFDLSIVTFAQVVGKGNLRGNFWNYFHCSPVVFYTSVTPTQ